MQGSLDTPSPALSNMELYPFAHTSEHNPMLFEVEFVNEGNRLRYSFEVLTRLFDKEKRQIVSEQLWMNSGKELIQIFERGLQRVEIKREKKVLSLIQYSEKLLAEFESKINKNLDPAELFLTHAFKTLISSEIADKVIDFFKSKLIVVSDFTLKKTNLTFSAADMPDKDFLAWNRTLDSFVKNADFGSTNVRNDQNYLLNYFKGKYGTLPYIDFCRLFAKGTEEEE